MEIERNHGFSCKCGYTKYEEKQILKHHVVFDQKNGSTTVEYYAIAPQEWIRDEMKKRSGKESE